MRFFIRINDFDKYLQLGFLFYFYSVKRHLKILNQFQTKIYLKCNNNLQNKT